MRKTLATLYFMCCILIAGMTASRAYIDPSSMTYIIQIIAGVAVALGAGIGLYWKRIVRFFSRRKEKRSAARRKSPKSL